MVHSEESKRKMSESHKGQTPWNKGLKNVQKPYWLGKKRPEIKTWLTPFNKGIVPWNKGLKGIHLSPESEFKSENMTGNKHPNWQGGITSETDSKRNEFKGKVLKLVLERDDYTCQLCGKRGGNLHVDHIQPWSEYVDGRFDMDNCRTLCIACHFGITFGKPMPVDSKWGQTWVYERSI